MPRSSWCVVFAVALAACGNGSNNFQITPPGGVDAGGIDGTRTDARIDAFRPDAPSSGASSDLSLAITGTPNPVAANSTLTYTIDVTNHGPDDASMVTVTDRLPDGDVAFQSASGIGWTCTGLGQIVTCTRPLLIVGAAPTITIEITTPPEFTSLSNTATVAAETGDTNISNNTQMISTTGATPQADLSFTSFTDSPDPVTPTANAGCMSNDCVDYVAVVHNAGSASATGVTVVFTLPIDGTFYQVIGAGWVCPAPVGGKITCTRSLAIASGADAPSIDLTWKAPSPGGYSIVCEAEVSSTSADPNTANNIASQDTTVFP